MMVQWSISYRVIYQNLKKDLNTAKWSISDSWFNRSPTASFLKTIWFLTEDIPIRKSENGSDDFNIL